ncbi:MAG: methyltransferase [Proteobacteria bacterium]|nr:methyltransferase [Pseudomonadota bacterium]NIS68798.1 methyltransferase [Pseudomonadota bacterium]
MILSIAQLENERGELEVSIRPDETLDGLFNGKLKIIQKRKGYRYSIDAILLASFCRLKKADEVIDLGTGNAIIPILLAVRNPTNRIVGVEIQAELVDMAHRNVALNGLERRIKLIHKDVRALTTSFEKASFDLAISNPPYRPVRTGRLNPQLQKAFARHEILGSLEDMARIASFLLRSGGRFCLIYPASRTIDMLLTLRESDLEPKRVRLIHSNEREEAKLVMAEAVKGGRRELHVLRPLFVYELDGHPTEEMDRIYSMDQDEDEIGVARDREKPV